MGMQINEKVIYKTFRKSAEAMIMGNITAFIGTAVDSLITSRMLGVSYVSSFQLVQPLILFVTLLGNVICSGLQSVYSRQIGAGKIRDAHTTMSVSILILLVICGMCATVYCVFAHQLVSGLGASDVSSLFHKEAVAYLYGISPGLIALGFQTIFNYIFMMEGRRKIVMIAAVLQTIVNCVGDLLVVKVFHGGLFGMGLASSVCYMTACAILIFSSIIRPISYKFRVKGIMLASLLEVIKMGLPGSAKRGYLLIQTWFLNTVLLTRISVQAIAAYSIISTLDNLLESVATGSAGTLFAMASVYVGDRDSRSLKITLNGALRYTLTMAYIMCGVVLVGAEYIIRPFIGTDGAEVSKLAVLGLRALALSIPLHNTIKIFQRYTQAVGDMVMAYLILAMNSVIFFIPSAFALVLLSGETGIWFAFLASEALTAITIMLMTSVNVKHIAVRLDDYLYLPDNMKVNDMNVLDESVGDIPSLIALSEKYQKYCFESSRDTKKAMLIALTIEEMGGNILSYNDKAVTVDIRLLEKDSVWVLRIRDNGQAFNPTEWMKIHHAEDEDVERNIGIRMISEISKRFDYISIMGMNNLLIYI